MRHAAGMVRGALLRALTIGEWVYLAALLGPLLALNLILGTLRAAGVEGGALAAARSLGSEALFNAGFVLVCAGTFLLFRRGVGRAALVVVVHLMTALLAVLSLSSYLYLRSTGSPLDYGIISYYVGNLADARGAIAAETPLVIWPLLCVVLIYLVAGPSVVKRWVQSQYEPRPTGPAPAGRQPEGSRASGRRQVSRRRFIAAAGGATAGAALLSGSVLYGRLAGAEASGAPVANLVTGKIQKNRIQKAASQVEVTNPLTEARLEATPRTRPRHVALIHLESVRSRSVTPYEPLAATTPYLEELAASSLLVERAYSTLPHTSKALVSLNTGLYPSPVTEIIEARPGGVPAPALVRLLGEHGYRSAWFQSAVGGFEDRPVLVENFGYDYFEAIEQMRTEGFDEANYLGYEDDVMLEPSLRWLRENAASPTLVKYLGVTPHHDYRVPERYGEREFSSKEMLNRYLNNVRYDDFWVSNIIEQYKSLGLYEDTIFVIYGDHGEGFGEHGRYQHDGVIWEEGLRAPLMIHAPGLVGGGRVPGPANLIDIPPTLVNLLGYELVGGSYPGRPVTELRGRRAAERTLFAGCRPDLLSAARIEGDEKYIYHFENQPEELYDLRRDPLERNNLAEGKPKEELERLKGEVLDWRAKSAALYEG